MQLEGGKDRLAGGPDPAKPITGPPPADFTPPPLPPEEPLEIGLACACKTFEVKAPADEIKLAHRTPDFQLNSEHLTTPQSRLQKCRHPASAEMMTEDAKFALGF